MINISFAKTLRSYLYQFISNKNNNSEIKNILYDKSLQDNL